MIQLFGEKYVKSFTYGEAKIISYLKKEQLVSVSIDLKQIKFELDCYSFELSSNVQINYNQFTIEYALKNTSDWKTIDAIYKSIFKIANLKGDTEYKLRITKKYEDKSILKEQEFKTLSLLPLFRVNTFGSDFAILELTNSFPKLESIEVQIRKNESNQWKNSSYQMKDFKIEGLEENSIYKMRGSVKYDKNQSPWTDESLVIISTLKSKISYVTIMILL